MRYKILRFRSRAPDRTRHLHVGQTHSRRQQPVFLGAVSLLLLGALVVGLSSCTTVTPGLPSVTLRADPTWGSAPLTVRFEAVTVATAASNGTDAALSYLWEFGDGTSASGPRVSHTYTQAGRFSVRLLVTGGEGEELATERTTTVEVVAPPRFEATAYAVGRGPEAVAIVDLDNDGVRDLVAANAESHDISLLIGDGQGGFTPKWSYPAIKSPSGGRQPRWIIGGDFNRDGSIDLVTVNPPDDNVSILLAGGLFNFGAPSGYALPHPRQALTADLDGDGTLDLLVLGDRGTKGRITLMRGRGTGEFDLGQTVFERSLLAGMALGDFNRDGMLDLAVACQGFAVEAYIFLNDGGAFTFMSPQELRLPAKPTALAVGDFNGDGQDDLLAASEDGVVSLLLGDGLGGFAPGQTVETRLSGVADLAVADLNADGTKDAVLVRRDADVKDSLAVLLGDGRGRLAPPLTVKGSGPAVFPRSYDLDRDGRVDLVLADPAHDQIRVLLNRTPR